MVTIKFKKLHPKAKAPTRVHVGDAGWDFYAPEDCYLYRGGVTRVGLGLALEVPPGYCLFIHERSGLAESDGVDTLAGVIDSSYRGEVAVLLRVPEADQNGPQTAERAVRILAGDRICQGLLLPVPDAEFREVKELSPSLRGKGGFGSTGR